jgi:hypothetical protein
MVENSMYYTSLYKEYTMYMNLHNSIYMYIHCELQYTAGTKCFEKLCITGGFEPLISCILSARPTATLQA